MSRPRGVVVPRADAPARDFLAMPASRRWLYAGLVAQRRQTDLKSRVFFFPEIVRETDRVAFFFKPSESRCRCADASVLQAASTESGICPQVLAP